MKVLMLFFFGFLLSAITAQSQATDEIARLKQATYSMDDSVRFEALKQLHYAYRNIDIDTASIYLEILKHHAEKTNNHRYRAAYYRQMGYWSQRRGKADSSRYYFLVSISYFQKVNDKEGLAKNHVAIGSLFGNKGQMDSALLYFRKAEAVFDELGSLKDLANVYNNIGSAYNVTDHSKCLEYYYKALKLSEEIGNLEGMALLYNNIGNYLIKLDRLKEAERELTRGIELSKQLQNWKRLSFGYSVLSDVYEEEEKRVGYTELSLDYAKQSGDLYEVFASQDKLIHTYLTFERWNKALDALNKQLITLDQLEFPEHLRTFHRIYINLGLVASYHKLGNSNKYQYYLGLVEQARIPTDKLTPTKYRNLLSLYEDVYEETGRYKKALEVSHLKDSIERSIINEQNNGIISQLKTQYETEQKEQEIARLQQVAEIQSLKLNTYLIGSVSLILLIVGGGFFTYRQYKTKRDKAAIELEQRFLRSQLNPHFIFNSMGAIQQYLLTESPEKASDYMGLFSRLMRQILENSREAFIPLEEEVNMLRNYLELQQLRFQHAFDYMIELDDTLDAAYDGIPPMFAQPFIENALEHGLFKKDQNKITIRFSKVSNGLIQLEIVDNGIGITESVNQVNNHQSLAIKITRERLEKMRVTRKSGFSLNTENVVNKTGEIKGFRVYLNLPSQLVAA